MARVACAPENYPPPLLALARYGLAEASSSLPDRPLPARPLDDDTWDEVLRAARAHRVTGPLAAAADDGTLSVTAAQATAARAAHRQFLARVLLLEGELVALSAELAAASIDFRVLKGSAVAHLDYADPALRSFIDLDILVRAEDIAGTVRTLSAAGFTRTLAEPRPGFDRRFDKGTTLRSAGGYELDLHRTFVLGPWGRRVGMDELWDGSEEFHLGGRTLRALCRPNRFLHACYHAALGDWPLRLGSLRDIAEMLPAVERDLSAVFDRATEWGVQAVVATAVADTRRLLAIAAHGELARWAERYVLTRRDEAWLALHQRSDKTFAAQALATVRVLPGLRDKAAYLRALALPDPAYSAPRHSSMLARFRYGLREARQGRARR